MYEEMFLPKHRSNDKRSAQKNNEEVDDKTIFKYFPCKRGRMYRLLRNNEDLHNDVM